MGSRPSSVCTARPATLTDSPAVVSSPPPLCSAAAVCVVCTSDFVRRPRARSWTAPRSSPQSTRHARPCRSTTAVGSSKRGQISSTSTAVSTDRSLCQRACTHACMHATELHIATASVSSALMPIRPVLSSLLPMRCAVPVQCSTSRRRRRRCSSTPPRRSSRTYSTVTTPQFSVRTHTNRSINTTAAAVGGCTWHDDELSSAAGADSIALSPFAPLSACRQPMDRPAQGTEADHDARIGCSAGLQVCSSSRLCRARALKRSFSGVLRLVCASAAASASAAVRLTATLAQKNAHHDGR